MELAAHLHKLPAEIDAMPYLETLMLAEAIHGQKSDELKTQAALHGIKI